MTTLEPAITKPKRLRRDFHDLESLLLPHLTMVFAIIPTGFDLPRKAILWNSIFSGYNAVTFDTMAACPFPFPRIANLPLNSRRRLDNHLECSLLYALFKGPESLLHPLFLIFSSTAFQILSTTSLSLHLLDAGAPMLYLSIPVLKTPLPQDLTVSGRTSPLHPTYTPNVCLNKSCGCCHL